jgi:hypothetical protein
MISNQYGVFDRRKHCGKQMGFQDLTSFLHQQDLAVESTEKVEIARQAGSRDTNDVSAREYTMIYFGSNLVDASFRILVGLEICEKMSCARSPPGIEENLGVP